jgi:hypothetical protein
MSIPGTGTLFFSPFHPDRRRFSRVFYHVRTRDHLPDGAFPVGTELNNALCCPFLSHSSS